MKTAGEASCNPLDIAIQRQLDGFEVGQDDDGHRLAFVFRGGGMAAVHNAGVADQLDRSRLEPEGKSLLNMADMVVGDSAGAIIGAAALSGQAHFTAKVFAGNLPHQNFISPKDALLSRLPFTRQSKRPLVDLSILHENLEGRLDVDQLFDNPTELIFVGANLKDMSTQVYSTKDGSLNKENAFQQLMHGMHLPLVAGAPEDAQADGGLLQLCSEVRAVESNATDIVSFANSPMPEEWKINPMVVGAVGLWAQRHGQAPKLGGLRGYLKFVRHQAKFMPDLASGKYADDNNVNMRIYYPEIDPEQADMMPSMMERDPEKLWFACNVGRNLIRRHVGLEPIGVEMEPARHRTLAEMAGLAIGQASGAMEQATDAYRAAIAAYRARLA